MQTTIAKPSRLEGGLGVDSGHPVDVRVLPAAAGTGIEFVRTDLAEAEGVFRARNDSVVEVPLRTVLANRFGHSLRMVEHAMAAFAAFGIDNLRVEVGGRDMPIFDGSALPYARMLSKAGRVAAGGERRAIRILEPVQAEMDGAWIKLEPAPFLEIAFSIDFQSRVVGKQNLELSLINGEAVDELLPARTFATADEIKQQREKGMLKGVTADSGVLIEDDRICSPGGLRYEDEFVRHKMLDALGDLYLVGHPILGRCTGHRAGHRLTHRLVRKLLDTPEAWEYETVPAAGEHKSVDESQEIHDREAVLATC